MFGMPTIPLRRRNPILKMRLRGSCLICAIYGYPQGDDEEDLNDDDLDLSEMSDEDANAVMEMLNPEERQAFQEMLEEHRNGAQDRSAEL